MGLSTASDRARPRTIICKHTYTQSHGQARQLTQAYCACSAFGRASHTHTLAAQNKVIKAAGEEDLRYMLLNRYPLRLNAVPDTMAGVIRELETLLPDIKRIIEN